jgi:ATP-dependent helicase/nuclease subunit A
VTARRPSDHAARERVLSDFDTTFLLEAGAGTGKTTVVVSRVLALLRSGRSTIDRIVAITFTDKAAGELKGRLRDEIERSRDTARGVPAPRLTHARVNLERAPVSTIHSFALALLKERPFEAGLDPGFTVAADVASDRTFEDAWEMWLDERMSAGDPVLIRAMTCGLSIASTLRKAGRIVAQERDVLGRAEEEPFFRAEDLVDSMRATVGILSPLKVCCVDGEDGAYQAILELEADLLRAERLDPASRESFLRGLKVTSHKGAQPKWNPRDACTRAKEALKAVKAAQTAFVEASNAHMAWSLRDLLRSFLETYEVLKQEGAIVDFQDLLLRTREVLTHSLDVRKYFQRHFDFILLDEFQDTDPLQIEIAFLLAEDPMGPPAAQWRSVQLRPGKLFLVGDPKQSIYRFRRADIALYQEAKRLILESGGEVLALDTSFRTVPSVVGFVNELFEDVFADPEIDPDPLPLNAYRAEEGNDVGTVALVVPESRLPPDGDRKVAALRPVVAETIAAFLASITTRSPWSIREASGVRPLRPGDVALLVRKTTPEFLGPVERALSSQGVPYRIVGGKEYFVRDEVVALRAVLRAIDNPADRLAVFAALRSPFFAFSDDDLWQYVSGGGSLAYQAPVVTSARNAALVAPAFELLARLHRRRRILPPSDLLMELFARTRALAGFRLRTGGDQMVANLWKTVDVARAYEAAGLASLREIVRFLEEEAEGGGDEGDSPVGEQAGAQVAVVTVHSAKGLEYPIVVLGDILSAKRPASDVVIDHAMDRGWLKIGTFAPEGWEEANAREQRQTEAEERRLLYVALTRARNHVVIPCLPGEPIPSWAKGAVSSVTTDSPSSSAARRIRRTNPDKSGTARFTVFDAAALRFDLPRPETASQFAPIEGGEEEIQAALAAEAEWASARSRRPALSVAEGDEDGPFTSASLREAAFDEASAAFGRLVHALLALPDLPGEDALHAVAFATASEFGRKRPPTPSR